MSNKNWYRKDVVPCETCDGSGSVWETLKGAGIMQTTRCPSCWGIGCKYEYTKLTTKQSKQIEAILGDTDADEVKVPA